MVRGQDGHRETPEEEEGGGGGGGVQQGVGSGGAGLR